MELHSARPLESFWGKENHCGCVAARWHIHVQIHSQFPILEHRGQSLDYCKYRLRGAASRTAEPWEHILRQGWHSYI